MEKSSDQLFEELIVLIKKYHPNPDLELVEKAYKLAKEAHGEQLRKSGEPYIIHPVCVAKILAELELDIESIVAGILHDVIEDTSYSYNDISNMFNEDIALLVDGVTKLTKMSYSSKEELQAENYRKMFLSMAKDIRVILIKIADRLHNMRTLNFMTPAKQKEKAQETIDIYAPLANRLGISKIKTELEDLSLRYLDPDAYFDLSEKIQRKQSEREAYVQNIVDHIKQKLADANISCEVYGRPKHFFSIYRKMHNKSKTLDQIFDLFAVRVLVNTVEECYAVFGVIQFLFTPVPGRFKDFITTPKPNMYQSLHNTLIGPEGLPFEVQIRTFDMHKTAEYGIAAHWKYKEGITSTGESSEEAKLTWLRQILEWQKDTSDNAEFMDAIKSDLDVYKDSVFCFTPRGEVISLTEGSTPVDFAYSIHSAIGNKMVGVRVNGKIVTFDYVIQNGDRIEIITSQNSKGPSLDWLKFVRTSQARTKINQWYKAINKEENIIKGKELLEKEARKKGLTFSELASPERIASVIERYSFKDWNSICAAVGHGGLKETQIINRLNEEYQKALKQTKTPEQIIQERQAALEERLKTRDSSVVSRKKSGIFVQGVGDIDVRFSKCCSPVPGDEIIGFVTRGRGVSIHRTDCINIINLSEDERHRLMPAQWHTNEAGVPQSFVAEIRISGHDRARLLMDILKVIADEAITIKNTGARVVKETAIIDLTIVVTGRDQLDVLCKKIYSIEGIDSIERVTT